MNDRTFYGNITPKKKIIKKNKKYQEISLRKYLTNEEVKRRTGVESVVKKVEASKNGLDI
jgi:hypothetical protein